MCRIRVTRTRRPYPGIRQILIRRDVFDEGEETMTSPEHWPDLSSIPLEIRYFLMLFVFVRSWSTACDILEAHPLLLAPWAAHFLRDFALGVRLSADDFGIFCTNIFILELAQALGMKKTRAFLTRFAG